MRQLRNCNVWMLLALSLATWSVTPAADARRHGNNNAQLQQIILGNFAVTQQRMRNQIATYVASGQLSPAQAANFTAQLDQLEAQSAAAASDPMQAQFIVNQFNVIGNQISASLSIPAPAPFVAAPYNKYLAPQGVHRHWNTHAWGYPVPPGSTIPPDFGRHEHPVLPHTAAPSPDLGRHQPPVVPPTTLSPSVTPTRTAPPATTPGTAAPHSPAPGTSAPPPDAERRHHHHSNTP